MRCKRFKRVRSKFGGYVRRCAKFSGGRSTRRRRGGYRKGRRPFNKGRKCKVWGVNKRGIRTCRSYGGTSRSRRDSRRGQAFPFAIQPKPSGGYRRPPINYMSSFFSPRARAI